MKLSPHQFFSAHFLCGAFLFRGILHSENRHNNTGDQNHEFFNYQNEMPYLPISSLMGGGGGAGYIFDLTAI